MVRRIRLARPGAPRRARRWAGPPPLLLLVTLAGFIVAPMVDEPAAPAPTAATVAHTSPTSTPSPASTPTPTPASSPTSIPTPTRTPNPTRSPVQDRPTAAAEPVRVGLASLNLDRSLTPAQAAEDARALTRRAAVDIVGWQEADRFGPELEALPGWETRTFPFGRRSSQLAVSWRRAEFDLVAARHRQVPLDEAWRDGRYPYGNRLVAVVTLRHRDTGRVLTVVDAHVPQPIGDLARPDRWVAGTADYDLAARADGPRRVPAGAAASAYQVLGSAAMPTFRTHGRRVDVVYVDRADYRAGRVRFAGRWVVDGLAGDHDALVTRLVIS